MDAERARELLRAERERIERALGRLGPVDDAEEADEYDPGNLASNLYQDELDAGRAAREVPLVGVDVRCPGGRAAYVGSDHADGVRLALAHLHARGHRRIAHVAGAANTLAGAERLRAFRREAAAFGLELSDELV